ncbi:MAG: LLM class flavin-dependent oxidoreductase [Armatimonadota bacterium]|nr:LLM class flavin-dependent oxidoreductase [Armatimonadota bacterium]
MNAGPLRFGLRFNSGSGTIREVVRWAQLAEEAGFDDLWYCQDLMQRDAWVVLTAVASATRRIRIGTCIVNPFSASPAEIAMRAASLQEYSEGRFVLGIGPGDPPYLAWAGLAQRRPLTGLREAVRLLRALLRGEDAPFNGDVFKGWTPGARLRFPLPSRPIPIYIGGQGPKVSEFMGEAGDGALPIAFPPETIDAAVGRIRAGAARAGRSLDGFDLAACVWWSVDETHEAAEEALRPLIAYYGPSLRAETLAPIGLTPQDFDEVRAAWEAGDLPRAADLVRPPMFRLAVTGTPEEVAGRVRWLQARGATQVSIGPPLGPDRERALRLTAERVIARFR